MPARFKLDENLPRDAEALLRKAGHDVHTALDEHLGGNLDPRVFDASQADTRKRALARAGDRGTLCGFKVTAREVVQFRHGL